MRKNEYRKYSELSAWDLDKGSRKYVDQSTPARRRLKKVLRKQARKTFARTWRNESYD